MRGNERRHERPFRSRITRFCYPVLLAVGVRVAGAIWLFNVFSTAGGVRTSWFQIYTGSIPNSSSWLWIFNAWDSFNYGFIAFSGYAHPNYVYLPALPILAHLIGLVSGNNWLGVFVVVQFFALASIVMFQLLSEIYMQPREALCATLLMSTFPYISVFTTLGYSEAVFLFSTLATWYYYKTDRMLVSSVFAGFASLTRLVGFVIVVPVFIDILKTKQYRRWVYLLVPVAFLLSWMIYCFLSAGDVFASWTDEGFWSIWANGQPGIKYGIIQSILIQGFRGVVVCCAGENAFDPAVLLGAALFAFILVKVWNVDRSLWAYAISLFGLLLFAAPVISLLRYLTFIFPTWLTVRVKNPVVVAVCVALFIPIALVLWFYALTRNWIG